VSLNLEVPIGGGGSVTLAEIEALFTAANQIFKGTGSGTGELIDFGTTLFFQFAAKGQLFVGTGLGTGAKLAVGSDGTVLTADSTQADGVKWATPSGGASLLARVQYAPSSYASNESTSITLVAVDATNLTIAFTVPASGDVLVRLTGAVILPALAYGYWALLDHTSHAQVGDTVLAGYAGNFQSTAAFLITGLTPGANLQYDWAYATSVTAIYLPVQGAQGIPSGVNGAPAVMEVWSA
jgi:hypothetical protein